MNKYAIIGIVLLLLIVGGVIYNSSQDNLNCTPGNGKDVAVTIVSKKLEWRYEPEEITVGQCDRVTATVINEDNFDHGFAIDALGVSQRLPANGTIVVPFTATKAGTFQFYCSVSCSDSKSTGNLPEGKVQTGPYKNTFRGHFEHLGKFIVEAIQALMP